MAKKADVEDLEKQLSELNLDDEDLDLGEDETGDLQLDLAEQDTEEEEEEKPKAPPKKAEKPAPKTVEPEPKKTVQAERSAEAVDQKVATLSTAAPVSVSVDLSDPRVLFRSVLVAKKQQAQKSGNAEAVAILEWVERFFLFLFS